ncbi:hypothetical protein BFU36_06450 [Sulfolobus sp. A20]|nr:hypothetical protein BFU36_06450 [Sulfolobus sp. A20]TRM74569.1 hypothetical protein DJ523_04605 [Sulfolobus sp. E5]TRM77152.1 hypothetical protein DJ528_07200 [Sulfolobus sp. B5]TRM95253.1 hypothetical protein DJ526_00965 [Sulfolobus sp. A20-N-G8]TRN03554.1 hypothetical protein DJ530_02630 [Sulfolobus sp. E1]
MGLVKKPKTFTELKRLTGLTDAGLYKAIKGLEKQNYIKKTEMGYIITPEGMKALGYNVVEREGIVIIYENLERDDVEKLYEVIKNIKNKSNFSIYIYKSEEEEEKIIKEIARIYSTAVLFPELFTKQ